MKQNLRIAVLTGATVTVSVVLIYLASTGRGGSSFIAWLVLALLGLALLAAVLLPGRWRAVRLTRTSLFVSIGIGVVVFAILALAFRPGASDVPGLSKDAPANSSSSQDFLNIPGQYPAPIFNGEKGNPPIRVSDCLNLSGTEEKTIAEVAPCEKAAYRVVQLTTRPKECAADVDQKYYRNDSQGELAACLDFAWSAGACLDMTEWHAVSVSCSDKSYRSREKPTKVILNTSAPQGCPGGGYSHPIRRFTVCTEGQK
ncbi:LppU/SCO3897 family protein [Mycobacteroides chelonae]|uniref:LppU/SCO3897 family protein n=1 Tax=Mycobacteroides chelonae TaxID=1774 RepID=UPI003B28A654